MDIFCDHSETRNFDMNAIIERENKTNFVAINDNQPFFFLAIELVVLKNDPS